MLKIKGKEKKHAKKSFSDLAHLGKKRMSYLICCREINLFKFYFIGYS